MSDDEMALLLEVAERCVGPDGALDAARFEAEAAALAARLDAEDGPHAL